MKEIQDAFLDKGISPPPILELDGRLHRFPADATDKKKSAWIVGFNNVTSRGENFCVVVGGSLKTGEEVFYQSNGIKLDKHDKKRIQEQIKKGQEQQAHEKRERNREAAKEAVVIWEEFEQSFVESKYHQIKRLPIGEGLGCRFTRGIGGARIHVPMRDIDGVLWGVQTIHEDCSKFFMAGQRVEGTFHQLGADLKEASEIYICEGFATGASIYEAIKKTVIVAFNAQNLVMVAKAIFEKYPDKAYIICGDDDRWTEINGVPKNPGREKAESASEACVGKLVFPTFENEETKPTDFNDLHCLEGIEKVRALLLNVTPEAHFVRALGHDEGVYFVFSNVNLQIQQMAAATLGTATGLCRLQPRNYWESLYPGPRDTIRWADAADDIMQKCHEAGIFKPDHIRGTGAWMDAGRSVYHCGDSLFYGSKYHPLSGTFNSRFMYNFDATCARMDLEPISDDDAYAFANAVQCAGWKRDYYGAMLASWLVLAPVSGALDWRPHIWLTGPAGTGKSWLMDNVCNKILRGYATFVQGQSTEAGIRQNQACRSLPIIFDEFETNDEHSGQRIKSVLELARQASSDTEAVVLKGSSDGISTQYRPRFSILVSSVRVNITHEEDMSRFTFLELERKTESKFTELEKFILNMPKDFGQRMARRSFEQLPVIISNSRVFHKIIGKAYGMRFGQQWGALGAGLASLTKPGVKLSEAEAEEFVQGLVKMGVFDTIAPHKDDQDESKALDHLLHSSMEITNFHSDRVKMPVLEVIRRVQAGEQISDQLERLGIKVEGNDVYIISNHEPIKKIYSRTKWAGGYSKALSRISNSQVNVQKWFGNLKRNYKCVKVSLVSDQ